MYIPVSNETLTILLYFSGSLIEVVFVKGINWPHASVFASES
jgi:hypothetical protein